MNPVRCFMKKGKQWKRWAAVVLVSPFVLFLVMAVLLYMPPVQNYVVSKAVKQISLSTGMTVCIERVSLAFPLDLVMHDMLVVDGKDTLLDAGGLRVNVQLLPLLEGVINVDGIILNNVRLNTASLLSDTQVQGRFRRLFFSSHGVDLKTHTILVDKASLEKARVQVVLSDTARTDTASSSGPKWVIKTKEVRLDHVYASVHMPGDSMRMDVDADNLVLTDGLFDLGKESYGAKRLRLDGALQYELPYEPSGEGLDYNHLNLSDVHFQVDTFLYQSGTLRTTLKGLSFTDRSGFVLSKLYGSVVYDDKGLTVNGLSLRTPYSMADASVRLDWNALEKRGTGTAQTRITASLGREDLLLLACGLHDGLQNNWPGGALTVGIEAGGNEQEWRLSRCEVRWSGVFGLEATGYAAQLTDSLRRSGRVSMALQTENVDFAHALLATETAGRFRFPPGMALTGWVRMRGSSYDGDLELSAGKGLLSIQGHYNETGDVYAARLDMRDLPLHAFMPQDSLYDFSGSVVAEGRGFNIFSPVTSLKGDVRIDRLRYASWNIDSVRLKAMLRHSEIGAVLNSHNSLVNGMVTLKAHLGKRLIRTEYDFDMKRISLQQLSGGRDTMDLSLSLKGSAYTDWNMRRYGAKGGLTDIRFGNGNKSYPAKDLSFDFLSRPDTAYAYVQAGDLEVKLTAASDVEQLISRWERFGQLLDAQIRQRRLEHDVLKQYMPGMTVHVASGSGNPVVNFLKYRGFSLDRLQLDLNTDSVSGLNGGGSVYGLNTGAVLLDTVWLKWYQDTAGVQTQAFVRNATRRNPNKFEARLDSYLLSESAGVELYFRDKNRREGIRLGVRADLEHQKGIRITLYPRDPILAFRQFEINEDNCIFLGNDSSLYANISLAAQDGTALRVYSTPNDSVTDLTVSVDKLNLSEMSALFPYMPSMSGLMNADVHLQKQKDDISVGVDMNVEDMAYDQSMLGDIGMNAVYMPEGDNRHYVNGSVFRNSSEIMTIDGIYDDTEGGAMEADLELTHFPLEMLNGFMGDVIGLIGYGEGKLTLGKSASATQIDGELKLDSAYLYSAPYGFAFQMENKPLSIVSGRLMFDDFKFSAAKSEPLVLNGNIDLNQLDNIRLDLQLRARNFELINMPRNDQSLVFGKVYADYEGTLKGSTELLVLRGMLNVLDRTDVTYILKDTPLSVEDRLSDLVQFVDFSDSVHVETEKPSILGLSMTMGISISDAARVRCELSEDGESYVDIEGGGDLTMKYTPQGELSLVGRYTAISGEMKYELPVIPLKTFTLENGSYVEFTGDAMNPTLNITAKERVKASVTENESTRSVAFDVGIAITKPLDQMGLEFTLEAPDDQTVQNQLAAMSREQRGKLAVTMLATGMYLLEGDTGGSSFNTNNALNAFLQSEIQNIAGSALKTFDIGLSVEDGTSAAGTTTTDYSFRFAKRFWGNRVNVIIGGKVSTGQDAQNSAESFIDNISLEYRLDRSATRYIRLFYDRNTQDPLEGQLIETGAGLVLRRKTDNLGELFIFRNPNRKKTKASNVKQ